MNAYPSFADVLKNISAMVTSSITDLSLSKKASFCLVALVGIILVARRPAPLIVKPAGTVSGNVS